MKKTVLAAAAVVLAVLALLAGCGKERKTPTVRIGVALYQQEDTFLATVVQNLEQLARAEEQNYEKFSIELYHRICDLRRRIEG